MDRERFDSLTRRLSSRRTALGGLAAAGILTALGVLPGQSAAAPCPPGADCGLGHSGKAKKKGGRKSCRSGTKSCKGRCIDRKAACPPAPDANCPVGAGVTSGYAWYLHTAQTFTERNGGRLKSASLWMRNTTAAVTGTYVLRLNKVDQNTGVPKPAETLAAARVATNLVSNTTLGWVQFTFPRPPKLKPGTQYALVLLTENGSGFEGPVFEHQAGNPCAGGAFFVSNGTGQPFDPSGTGTDVAFKTKVKA